MKLYFTAVLLTLFCMCSSNSYFSTRINSYDTVIAVLPFSGVGVSQTTKNLLADELNNIIYVEKKIQVIDRSHVNFLIHQEGISNPYSISSSQIIKISDSLQASVVVLGFISKKSYWDNLQNQFHQVTITVRFLEGSSARVMGIMTKSHRMEEFQIESIQRILKKMVGDI
jgi:hypothetical protein